MELNIACDIELEKLVIGTMIDQPSCISDLVGLSPDVFTQRWTQQLFKGIIELWNENEDLITVQSVVEIAHKNKIDLMLVNDVLKAALPSAHMIRFYAEKLEAIGSLRKAGELGRKLIAAQTLRDKDEIRDFLTQAEMKIAEITNQNIQEDTLRGFEDVLLEVHEDLHTNIDKGGGITGISSGFIDLDRATSGFQKQDLIILAARPSMGKSAFALNVCLNMVRAKKKVAFFNLEMSRKQMGYRLIASEGNLDLHALRSGRLNPQEYEKYTQAVSYLAEKTKGHLWLDDQTGLTVPEIKAKARKIQREHGLDCIIIDYLGLIEGIKGEYHSRTEEVSKNSRMLKLMAKELDVPVICLCQLSRACEQRQDKRPMLSDLRESGSIEQDADMVMFLYRDDYYNEDSEKKNIAELIIAKQRNGPTGTLELLFMKNSNKFLSLDERVVAS